MKLLLSVIIIFSFWSCSNNKKEKTAEIIAKNQPHVSTPKNNEPAEPSVNKTHLDVKGMQLFEYSNDSLIQRVYVKDITTAKIRFALYTLHKISKKECYFSDTAKVNFTGANALYDDEDNEDDPYGAREYIYNKDGNFISIGIDVMKKNRLFVVTADKSVKRFENCNFNSVATLRKK